MLDQGQDPREEVLDLIEGHERLWVRLAAVRTDDRWCESLLEIVAGTAPPSWSQQHWEYRDVVFLSGERTGAEVGSWLRTGVATVNAFEIALSTVDAAVRWERRASQSPYQFEPLRWPHRLYHLAGQPLARGPSSGALVGPAAPSFVGYSNAAAAFFGIAPSPGASFDHIPPTFRDQDLSGRIVVVRHGVAGVEVRVEGSGLGDTFIELAYDSPGQSVGLADESSQVVQFDTPGGLASGSWVVLKREFGWVDRRFLNWPHTATPDPGVELVTDQRTALDALVLAGEGPGVEFKIELPSGDKAARRKVARTVAAFANGAGGTILLGVRDEDGAPVGLAASEVTQAAEDAVANFVRNLVTPLPQYTLDRYEVDGQPDRIVLALNIDRGTTPPYGVDPANPQYYVRRGGTTFPASADEVRALARSRPPADVNGSTRLGNWPRI